MVTLAEVNSLKQLLQEEKDRAEFHNESCKRYLVAYEKAKKEVDRLQVENDRLKSRISEIKEISMAKEANFEMISHLGSLDQEFYQGTIEKLRQEVVLLQEENKLLKDFSEVNSKDDKKNVINMIKNRQEQILIQNTQLLFTNEQLKNELEKKAKDFAETSEKYQELLQKQLDLSRLFVIKDEEIRFWKCALIELLCGEVLNNYAKESEFSSIIDAPLEPSEKFIKVKEKLLKSLKQKTPILISHDSEEMITEKSFILASVSPSYLVSSVTEAVLSACDKIQISLTNENEKKQEIIGRSSKEIVRKVDEFSKNSKEVLIHVAGEQDVWIYDLHQAVNPTKTIIQSIFEPLTTWNSVKQGLRTAESIYILTE